MSRDNNIIDFKARKKAAEQAAAEQKAAEKKAQRAQKPARQFGPIWVYLVIILIFAGSIAASFR